jgi:hypothetical protein
MTPKEIYSWAISSPENTVRFIVTTHYEQVLARANSAGIIVGAASQDDLVAAIMRTVVSPSLFAYLINVTPDTTKMNDAAKEAFAMILADRPTSVAQPQLQMQRSVTGGGGGGGSVGGGGGNSSSSSLGGLWNSDTTGDAVSAIPDWINAIACAAGNTASCPQANTGPVIVQNPNTPQPPPSSPTWVPWVIGGVVVTVVLAVVILVGIRMSRK